MLKESDILYSKSGYWIKTNDKKELGFEVYQDGITHATRRAIIGYTGQEGLEKAKQQIERFLNN